MREVAPAAIDLARLVAEDVAGSAALVGEHVEVQVDGDRLLTHLFRCLMPGYTGWQWSVTLVRVPRSRTITVDGSGPPARGGAPPRTRMVAVERAAAAR